MSKLVVSVMVYVENGWYGDRYRYFYAGQEGNGFENKTQARKSAGALKRYVKERIKYRFGAKGSISGDIVIGDINNEVEMPTYRHSVGPCWSCINCEVEADKLVKVKVSERW